MNKKTVFSRFAPALLLALLCLPLVAQDNPFLGAYKTPYETPPFDRIQIGHYLPAVQEGIKPRAGRDRRHRRRTPSPPRSRIPSRPWTGRGELLARVNAVFYSLLSALTSPQMQEVANQIAPLLSAHRDNIALNAKLFARVKAVYDRRAKLKLTAEQLYLLENTYRGFVRSGALLDEKQKARMRDINRDHALLTLKFDDNLLAETNSSYIVVDNPGRPGRAARRRHGHGGGGRQGLNMPGKWVFTTQRPSWTPFLQYAEKRPLREALYTAYFMRGDRDNDLDNKARPAEDHDPARGALQAARLSARPPTSTWRTAWPRRRKRSTSS